MTLSLGYIAAFKSCYAKRHFSAHNIQIDDNEFYVAIDHKRTVMAVMILRLIERKLATLIDLKANNGSL